MTPRIAFAPGAALVGRMVRTSLTVAALTCGTGAAAFAQSVPSAPAPVAVTTTDAAAQPAAAAPATTTIAQTTPSTLNAQRSTTVGQSSGSVGHFPIIDFVVTFSQPGSVGPSNTLPAVVKGGGVVAGAHGLISQYHTYDPLDLGGTVKIPVTSTFYFAFDRITEGTLNQAVERTIISAPLPFGVGAGPVYPGVSRDIILQDRADWQFSRQLLVEAGLSFRHRLYANDGSGVSSVPFLCANGGLSTGAGCTVSSTEHHYGYLGFTYTTKPWKELWYSTFALNLTGDAQNVDHHVAVTCSAQSIHYGAVGCPALANTALVGYLDENSSQDRYYETTQGVTWNIPVDRKHKVTFSDRFRWGALNFYENQPFPFRWSAANDLILTKVFSQGFSLTMRHSDYHSVEMGTVGVNGLAPFGTFLSPNAIHVASWDLLGSFHLDTNSWFH